MEPINLWVELRLASFGAQEKKSKIKIKIRKNPNQGPDSPKKIDQSVGLIIEASQFPTHPALRLSSVGTGRVLLHAREEEMHRKERDSR